MKHTRAEVYAVIDGERNYQDAQCGNAKRHEDMPPMTVTGRLSAEHPNLQQTPQDPRIRSLITALGVQCMERWGAPPRVNPTEKLFVNFEADA